MNRVVVTGLGTVNPIGNSVPEFADALKSGRSGFGPITKFSVEAFSVKNAYEIKVSPGRPPGAAQPNGQPPLNQAVLI